MKTYIVYQFSRELMDEKEKNIATDIIFSPSSERIMQLWQHYNPVMLITAKRLDEVFEIGNIGPSTNVQKLTDRAHSVSVGDVIGELNSQHCRRFYVDNVGFGEVSI